MHLGWRKGIKCKNKAELSCRDERFQDEASCGGSKSRQAGLICVWDKAVNQCFQDVCKPLPKEFCNPPEAPTICVWDGKDCVLGTQEWETMNLQCFATRMERFVDLNVAKRSCAGNGNCVGIYDFNCLGEEYWTCGSPMQQPSQSCGHVIRHTGESYTPPAGPSGGEKKPPASGSKQAVKCAKTSAKEKKCAKNKNDCEWDPSQDPKCVPRGSGRRRLDLSGQQNVTRPVIETLPQIEAVEGTSGDVQ